MTPLERDINRLSPFLYQERAENLNLPPWKDMSHSNQCQYLTFDMMEALRNHGHDLRRELHEDENGNWHYLLVHESVEADPSDEDLVTDLNPWQYTSEARLSGYLHASRDEIMTRLTSEGAPDYFIALRGLQTIKVLHMPRR